MNQSTKRPSPVRPSKRNTTSVLMAGLCAAGLALPAMGGDFAEPLTVAPPEDEWQFNFGLYAWMPGITGQTAASDIDMDFEDILDNLSMTFMGMAGLQKGPWTIRADVLYLDMDQDLGEPVIDEVGLTTWIFTPTISYTTAEGNWGKFDVLAGARYVDIESSVTRNLVGGGTNTLKVSGGAWDAIVGVRGHYNINDRWFIPYHFDIGAGGTDLSWQAFAGFGYRFQACDAIIGYRHLDIDVGGKAVQDLEVSGPMIGAKFSF